MFVSQLQQYYHTILLTGSRVNTLKLPWLLFESVNEQASAILDSNIQYISWSTEVGRWHHVKKQG